MVLRGDVSYAASRGGAFNLPLPPGANYVIDSVLVHALDIALETCRRQTIIVMYRPPMGTSYEPWADAIEASPNRPLHTKKHPPYDCTLDAHAIVQVLAN